MANNVTLNVNGMDFSGWQSIQITRSMRQLSASFQVGLSDRWSSSTVLPRIVEGAACMIAIDGEYVLYGHVDERAVSYDASSHSITITGRDNCADLVDCSVQPRQQSKQDLLQIAQHVCAPFGIAVVADTAMGAVFSVRDFEPTQTVFELLSQLAASRGLLLLSDGLNTLHITTAANASNPVASLRFGKNIISGSGTASAKDRFRDYTMLQQSADSKNLKALAHDSAVTRYRPLTLFADDPLEMNKRVQLERNMRAGRGHGVNYSVAGWRDDTGALYQPNTTVLVTDPHQQPVLRDTVLMIESCAYQQSSDNGTTTALSLIPLGSMGF